MLSIEIQLFGLRRTNNKKLFVSLPKADDTSQEVANMKFLEIYKDDQQLVLYFFQQ